MNRISTYHTHALWMFWTLRALESLVDSMRISTMFTPTKLVCHQTICKSISLERPQYTEKSNLLFTIRNFWLTWYKLSFSMNRSAISFLFPTSCPDTLTPFSSDVWKNSEQLCLPYDDVSFSFELASYPIFPFSVSVELKCGKHHPQSASGLQMFQRMDSQTPWLMLGPLQ